MLTAKRKRNKEMKNALKKATRSTKQLKKQTNLMSYTVYIYLGRGTRGDEITHYHSL